MWWIIGIIVVYAVVKALLDNSGSGGGNGPGGGGGKKLPLPVKMGAAGYIGYKAGKGIAKW